MQHKLLVKLLLGVSALILYSHLNWNGVYCKEEMANPKRSIPISNSGEGIEIQIKMINSTVPPELNTTVSIDRAVCIKMTKGHPTIKDESFPATAVKIEYTKLNIMDKWTKTDTYFYICTSPQVADFFFHRVEQIHWGSEQRVSKVTLNDKRLEAEQVEIRSGALIGKSTASIKVVTYRSYNDWKTERKYSGSVKVITLV